MLVFNQVTVYYGRAKVTSRINHPRDVRGKYLCCESERNQICDSVKLLLKIFPFLKSNTHVLKIKQICPFRFK